MPRKATPSKAAPKKKAAAKKAPAKKVIAKKAPAKKKADAPVKKIRKTPQLVRGMKDITPVDSKKWRDMYRAADSIASAYAFDYFSSPILEDASLFTRTLGKSSDVVSKEMYAFEDKDGSKLALRPEGTASAARSYITSGMIELSQPVKLWYYGPMFRHDRPQAGRYRQFHQFGCESLGKRNAALDAELIVVAYNFIRDLGLETSVYVNSIGTPDDRERYIVELVGYLRSKRSYLSDESKAKISKNPLRILDSKDENDIEVLEDAPQIIDWLSESSKAYFMEVLEYLDEADIPYALKPTLVRGLDYYTDTVFELFSADDTETAQNALGGGGRYDLLIEQLGGQPTPGAGFSVGLERVQLALQKKRNREEQKRQEEGLPAPKVESNEPKIFFAHLGDQARRRMLRLIEDMRREGLVVGHNLGKPALKAQLELADKYGSTHAVILGQKELQDGTIIIRDMSSGIQEIVDQKKLKKELTRILEAKN
jgi:histidyl-tRNA synthetase